MDEQAKIALDKLAVNFGLEILKVGCTSDIESISVRCSCQSRVANVHFGSMLGVWRGRLCQDA